MVRHRIVDLIRTLSIVRSTIVTLYPLCRSSIAEQTPNIPQPTTTICFFDIYQIFHENSYLIRPRPKNYIALFLQKCYCQEDLCLILDLKLNGLPQVLLLGTLLTRSHDETPILIAQIKNGKKVPAIFVDEANSLSFRDKAKNGTSRRFSITQI
jgi:hypothetical protein